MTLARRVTVTYLALFLCLFAPFAGQAGDEAAKEGGITGTGIVGEITELGSIIVNGHRIEIPDELQVKTALGAKPASMLLPGDVVAVAVGPKGNDWSAQAIAQIHALVGPVGSLSSDGFVVLGVNVTADPGLGPVNIGDWVAVSGFWARDAVNATKIEQIEPRETVSIQGSYSNASADATPIVGSLKLPPLQLENAREGDVLRVEGRIADQKLSVTDVHLGLFDIPVGLVMVEGYFSDVAPSGHYTVSGAGVSSFQRNLGMQMPIQKIRICGVGGEIVQQLDHVQESIRRQLQRLGC